MLYVYQKREMRNSLKIYFCIFQHRIAMISQIKVSLSLYFFVSDSVSLYK